MSAAILARQVSAFILYIYIYIITQTTSGADEFLLCLTDVSTKRAKTLKKLRKNLKNQSRTHTADTSQFFSSFLFPRLCLDLYNVHIYIPTMDIRRLIFYKSYGLSTRIIVICTCTQWFYFFYVAFSKYTLEYIVNCNHTSRILTVVYYFQF